MTHGDYEIVPYHHDHMDQTVKVFGDLTVSIESHVLNGNTMRILIQTFRMELLLCIREKL